MNNDPMLRRFLTSPGMAMAGSALNNMSAMRRGMAPQISPIQAYQDTVLRNALHEKQMTTYDQTQQMNELRMQRQRQELNPFHEYETARDRGLLPEGMTLQQFEQLGQRGHDSTSVIKNFSQWRQLNPNASPAEEAAAFDNLARAPLTWRTGPGMLGVTGGVTPGAPGATRELGNYSETINREADLAGAAEGAVQNAQTTSNLLDNAIEQTHALRQAYGVADRMNQISTKYLEMLETGAVDTGLAKSFMLNTFGVGSEELAAMNAEAVEQVLQNLQITNLAPVTVQELRTVAGLWANIAQQNEPNQGVLRRAINRTQDVMDRVKTEAAMQADAVKEYGGQGRFDSVMRANPWLRDVYQGLGPGAGAPPPPADPTIIEVDDDLVPK